jgi:hypothetical protein
LDVVLAGLGAGLAEGAGSVSKLMASFDGEYFVVLQALIKTQRHNHNNILDLFIFYFQFLNFISLSIVNLTSAVHRKL